MDNNQTTERRANPRREADWRVLFGPAGNLATGFLADLSPIGVSIVSERQFPVGTEIEVHFGVEDEERRGKLRMRAIVRHSGQGRIGVHFIGVDTAQREHWWKIMRGEL